MCETNAALELDQIHVQSARLETFACGVCGCEKKGQRCKSKTHRKAQHIMSLMDEMLTLSHYSEKCQAIL